MNLLAKWSIVAVLRCFQSVPTHLCFGFPRKDVMALFSTNDLYLAAFLVTRGHEASVTPNGDYCTFNFPPSVEADAQSYSKGRATVNARHFANTTRQLKARARAVKA
jgi:hypothetical protein